MEKNKGNKVYTCLFIIIIILIIGLIGYDVYLNVNKKIIQTTNITKTEKEVTVTDKGIAEAVDKLYNATVIVELTEKNEVVGWGSGFVYKVDGDVAYVITNYHVTDGYNKATIEFTNGEKVEGTVIGGDEYTDVSVVKIASDKVIEVANIGESAQTQLGDTVFAIGTPVSMNFKFTVTRGILSGKDRLMSMSSKNSSSSIYSRQTSSESWYINLLQIDASINSGNSGGPLANSNGEVIGITNSKLSSSSIENIGFAVPIEDVLNIANQVIENGVVERPFLGASLTNVSSAIYQGIISEDVDTQGTVLVEIVDGSCLDKAKFKKGDIITKLGDFETPTYMHLKYYLYRFKVGEKVKITFLRDGMELTAEVTLEKKK